jgi:hypothetical protein
VCFLLSFFVEAIRSSAPALVQTQRDFAGKKLDVVGIAGAAFSDIHAPAGRSCARSRPMRIFAIAVRDYDSSIA